MGLGISADSYQAEAVMARYDANRSGSLDLAEFRKLVLELRSFQAQSRSAATTEVSAPESAVAAASTAASSGDDIQRIFNTFDTDGSGDVRSASIPTHAQTYSRAPRFWSLAAGASLPERRYISPVYA